MSSAFRPNKFLNKIIPTLVFLMMFFGSKLVLKGSIPYLFDVVPQKLHHLLRLYKLLFISQVSMTVSLYLAIYFNLFDHRPNDSHNKGVDKILNKSIVTFFFTECSILILIRFLLLTKIFLLSNWFISFGFIHFSVERPS